MSQNRKMQSVRDYSHVKYMKRDNEGWCAISKSSSRCTLSTRIWRVAVAMDPPSLDFSVAADVLSQLPTSLGDRNAILSMARDCVKAYLESSLSKTKC